MVDDVEDLEMVMEEAEERPAFVLVPDGTILEAVIEDIKEQESMYYKEPDGVTPQKQISFRFKVTSQGQFEGRTLFGNVAKWFSTDPNCRLRLWIQEIMGRDSLPADFKVNLKHLVGLTCRIMVSEHLGKAKDGVTDQKKNKVTDVLRDASIAAEPF